MFRRSGNMSFRNQKG